MRLDFGDPDPANEPPALMQGFGGLWSAVRLLVAIGIGVLYVFDLILFPDDGVRYLFLTGVVLFLVVSLELPLLWRFARVKAFHLAWWVLPVDAVAVGLLVVGGTLYEDPFFPIVLGVAFYYVVLMQRGRAWVIALVPTAAYVIGHVVGHGNIGQWADWAFLIAKAMIIPYMALLVGAWLETEERRTLQLNASKSEIGSLNEELTRRLAELHVVAEITEVIHSTLDFDSIGFVVVDSLKKALNIPTCSLMVINRDTDETVFSVSSGMDEEGAGPSPMEYLSPQDVFGDPEEFAPLFTCTDIIQHNEMAVLFCCPADRLDELTDDDTLVLQAVSSELVVAVENSQLYQLTKRLSITDELTGLNNYRFLQQRLDQEYERANRYNRYLSLLMIDIDHFKNFNDAHGHIAGDRALAELAQVLLSCVREVDITTRYGGEEFSIILPETDAAGAFVVADKIRETVSFHGFADADGDRGEHLTVSVGVATFPVHSLDREGLLRQADDALYQAKHFGRDRVRAPRIVSEAAGQ